MDQGKLQITQLTSTALPLAGKLGRLAPPPASAQPESIGWRGPARTRQWVLDGPGWNLIRPVVDFALLCTAMVIALGGLSATAHVSAIGAPLLVLPPLVMALMYVRGLYGRRLRALVLDGIVPMVGTVSIGAMGVAVIGLFLNGQAPAQSEVVRAWLFALVALAAGRLVLVQAQRWARSRRLVGRPVLIVGAGVIGSQIARRLDTHPEYGLVPVGFIDDDPRSTTEVGGRDVPVLGAVEELHEMVQDTGVRDVIVAFSSVADARVSRLIQRCQELGVDVSVVPRMFDAINDRVVYDNVGGLPVMSFTSINPHGVQFMIKYAIDKVVASVALALLSPLLAIVALAVKLSTGGPVLFRQPRIGLDGREFEMLKFRTMRGAPSEHGESDAAWAQRILDGEHEARERSDDGADESDEAGGEQDGDDRRTRIGLLLRKLSIDELPQLWNVCAGDMSLIGPRPERASYVKQFESIVYRYSDRHRVKSGITGWAQVHGLRGKTSLVERIEWDNYYIAHWSLGLDLKILLLTVAAAFRNSG
jgi:exopolysaccharide biosynthesis polyprenyl glycosylphosphotransferase